ncbi:hypothetical protein JTE90_007355, partial [Oedothorax gibbosus]
PLPLPTFSSDKAVPLGALRGYGSARQKITLLPGFSRANRGAPDTARDRCFYENTSLSPDEPIPGHKNSYKEKNSSRVLRRRLRVRLRYRLGPEGTYLRVRVGEY